MSDQIQDAPSWDLFLNGSKKRTSYPPKKIDLENRLVCHTKNFFVVGAIGAFVPGYLMIISKKLISSYALLESKELEELYWLIQQVSNSIEKTYKKKVVLFEHGMCACVGGLDRAHLHLMPIDESVVDNDIVDAVNRVLNNRKAGINFVEFNDHKFENIHDIKQIIETGDEKKYKIDGKLLIFNDLQNLSVDEWPLSALGHVQKGGHYIFFKSVSNNSSFLTTQNFQTQFGREVVYEIIKYKNNEFSKKTEQILKKNAYSNVWRWQEFSFKENIYKTMLDLIPELNNISKNEMYNFKTFQN
jgi:diadenosine tetraphosphate (Ap4A) HIT family hydrolase